jgi:hypothetical protein
MTFVHLALSKLTDIAARFLFRPFAFPVDRHDLERFDLAAQEKSMLAAIDSICFEIGTIGIDLRILSSQKTWPSRSMQLGILAGMKQSKTSET